MGYKQALARNPRLLFWGKVLLEVKMLAAVAVLFFNHRDVGIDEVFWLSIVWAIVSLATEVPSGYLADWIGRKRTLILGSALYLGTMIMQFYVRGFAAFAVLFALMSFAFSCFSGTDSALLLESLAELGKEDEMHKFNARLSAAKSLPRIALPVIGAFIAKDLTESQFSILIWINVVTMSTSLVLHLFLTEPKRKQRRERGFFREALVTIWSDPWLLYATMSRTLVFFAGFLIFRAHQPLIMDNGGTVMMIGYYYLLVHVLLLFFKWNLHCFLKYIKPSDILNGFVLVGAALLGLSVVYEDPWVIMITLAFGLAFLDMREPLFDKAFYWRMNNKSRATTLSALNMVKSVLDIPVYLIVGWYAAKDIEYAVIIAIALCVFAVAFFPMRDRDFV